MSFMLHNKWNLKSLGIKVCINCALSIRSFCPHKKFLTYKNILLTEEFIHLRLFTLHWHASKYIIIIMSVDSFLQGHVDCLTPLVFILIYLLNLYNFHELVTVISRSKGLMREAPYDYLNPSIRLRKRAKGILCFNSLHVNLAEFVIYAI